jgi:(1->4)-alpha-D-glucan 1-alpha-D-glucosylmutase
MAKGVEDTAFYVYNRIVSLNEVGGAPDRFGTALDTFHGQNIERIKNWPHSLIATSTHDTKRGEDVRARINVLSEMPVEWAGKVRTWSRLNKKKKTKTEGVESPDRNEEYLLYQTLIGVWPIGTPEGAAYDGFVRRIRDYMLKASRESKVNTSWISPNRAYEDALLQFIDGVLSPLSGNLFLADFLPFQRMVSRYGMFNSLSQTLLKICSPGVPDFYQGTELWDFSLVDPDNRRPVEYEKRLGMLAELQRREAEISAADLAGELTKGPDDGRIKLHLIRKALTYRAANRALFEQGDYVPLTPEGEYAGSVCAFERRYEGKAAIIVIPRLLTHIIPAGESMPVGSGVWKDTIVMLAEADAAAAYKNVFTGEAVAAVQREGSQHGFLCSDIFSGFPVALLERTV